MSSNIFKSLKISKKSGSKGKVVILFLACLYALTGCGQVDNGTATVSVTEGQEVLVPTVGTTPAVSQTPTASPAPTTSSTLTASPMPTTSPAPTPVPTPTPYTLRLGFVGDMNLDENWATTLYLNEQENGIYDCIDPALIEEVNGLDIFMVNNEFTYSDRGTPMENKYYTFRAKPERVEVLNTLGTDIVLLANNHIFDYGAEAFADTLSTLETAGIAYVGAGNDLEEACEPVYFEYDGVRIAYVAASKAEKYKLTPQAGENTPGILRCYDETLFLEVIGEAAAEADYVVASVHFGTEYEEMADASQRELAYAMIDAGADAVIGSHAHVLQGMEFYEGKPIIYNLGNFWFNDKDLYSCVVELTVMVEPGKLEDSTAVTDMNESGMEEFQKETSVVEAENVVTLTELKFLPCTQYDCYTHWEQEGELREEILAYEESISFGIAIDENGVVTECERE